MGGTSDLDLDLNNGECTFEIELVSVDSDTDPENWPAIFTLT